MKKPLACCRRTGLALRALRSFASSAPTYLSFSSGFLLRKARQRTAKPAKKLISVGVVSKESRPYMYAQISRELKHRFV